MDRKPVKSSNVKSIGYDPETKTLEVEYLNGGVYQHEGVGPEHHKALMGAKSIGAHLHKHIKPKSKLKK
jgi:hypothetical protein